MFPIPVDQIVALVDEDRPFFLATLRFNSAEIANLLSTSSFFTLVCQAGGTRIYISGCIDSRLTKIVGPAATQVLHERFDYLEVPSVSAVWRAARPLVVRHFARSQSARAIATCLGVCQRTVARDLTLGGRP
ncbi:MAG: hypothetical protein HQL40_15450 [Alphaproteobacteria bacterium]|nr:hypothetical protein [Alphaproteobacteria bacterium]